MVAIISSVLSIILKLIPIFISKAEERKKYEQIVVDAIKRYQKGVLTSAKAREVDEALDRILEERWKAKYGNVPPPPK
jgi:hypothetical protein